MLTIAMILNFTRKHEWFVVVRRSSVHDFGQFAEEMFTVGLAESDGRIGWRYRSGSGQYVYRSRGPQLDRGAKGGFSWKERGVCCVLQIVLVGCRTRLRAGW